MENSASVKINPKVYPLEVVYSAAYSFIDRAYIMLDGDPETEIIARIKPKRGEDAEKLGDDFGNELLLYADYLARAKTTKEIREMFLQRALITNDPGMLPSSNLPDIEDDEIEDPEEIAVPWEEKYGNREK